MNYTYLNRRLYIHFGEQSEIGWLRSTMKVNLRNFRAAR